MSGKVFTCLGQARLVRDRIATYAKDDVRRLGTDAPAIIERVCTAEGDYRAAIEALQKRAFERWDGNGFPDWTYLSDLGDAVEYIAATECEEVTAALAAKHVTDSI